MEGLSTNNWTAVWRQGRMMGYDGPLWGPGSETIMLAIQPPPVPSARLPLAGESRQPGGPRRFVDAVDEFVFTIYRAGFVQSLIVHVAVLLLLAVIVVRPDLPRPPAMALEFVATGAEVEPDVAALELPAFEPAELDVVEDAAPVPEPELAAVERDPVEVDMVEPALFSIDDRPAGPDATALLVDVPVPAGGFAGGTGHGSGGGPAIGGEIGRRLKAAGAGTGDVQVSIAWSNVNDIDLHVLVEPLDPRAGNSIINFMNRVGIAGGCLDVDRNVQPTTRTPVENVFWGRGAAPLGRYTVAVHHYRDWGGGDPTEVEVVTLVDGKEDRFYVVLRPGDPVKVVTSFRRGPKGGAAVTGTFPRPPVRSSRPVARGSGPPAARVPRMPLE